MCLYALYTHREKRCAAVFLLLFIALVPGIFVKHRTLHTPNRSLVSHLHLSHLPALCFLCSMLIIGCSTTLTCFLQQTTIEIVFTKIVSTLFFFFKSWGRRRENLKHAPNPAQSWMWGSISQPEIMT